MLKEVNWWDLPDWINLKLSQFPPDIRRQGKLVTVKRLRGSNSKEDINQNIVGIKKCVFDSQIFKVKFPIIFENKTYLQLYALMVSEGSYKTEFSLNVPEKEFHDLFKDCIKKLISKEASNLIRYDYNNGFLRSRAPAIIRHLLLFPSQIPLFIFKNKNFAKEYLKIAFEAEGSPILNNTNNCCKRYLKLSRYVDITHFVTKENLPLGKRIYSGTLKKKYPHLFNKIKDYSPKILQGEQILLRNHFNIDSTLNLEAIRKNQTNKRCGKITARWVLFIYANNIDKFIKEIGFISKRKNKILKEMKKIKARNPQYSSLKIIKKIEDDKKCFYRKDFIKEMKKKGYKGNPGCYLWRYEKRKLVKKISRGYYEILF